jgi:membrane protease YdiL (CAAX protease family)
VFAGLVLLIFGSSAIGLLFGQVLRERAITSQLARDMLDLGTRPGLMTALFSFLFSIAVLWVVVSLIHKRELRSLIGEKQAAARDFFRVFRALIILFAILLAVPMPEHLTLQFHQSFGAWLPWLLPGLAVIFIQIAAEELVFRGYLQSQLAARFENPAVWILLPSILFGLMHYNPADYGSNAIWVVAWATLFGVIAADLTARSGNLGAAFALHFANNINAILIVGMQDYWDSLALLNVPYNPKDTDVIGQILLLELIMLLCLWLSARIALRR